MRRRHFITFFGAVTLLPFTAGAQQRERARRVAVLRGVANDAEGQTGTSALRRRLQELGWTEGRTIEFEVRWATGDAELGRVYAAELVRLAPDVILAESTLTCEALRKETRTIPIVFVGLSDPVGSGLISNLARPEANLTGISGFEYSMGGKWLELLKEISPEIRQIAMVFNPDTAPIVKNYIPFAQEAATRLSVTLSAEGVRNAQALDRAIAALAGTGSGLMVMPDTFTMAHRKRIIDLAERHRLPATYPWRAFAASGGLLVYGPDPDNSFVHAATYIDRILRGASPADLPVEVPTNFNLTINLKTANALGLTVPPSLLARADEVIE
jgi:putative tryptophan/tyrosine transport system substrate-binding protein